MTRVAQGDCLKLLSRVPDKSVHLILSDLPFGTTGADWDKLINFELLWKHYSRIVHPNGALVLFGNQPFTTELIRTSPGYEFSLSKKTRHKAWFKYEIIHEKSKASGWLNSKARPMMCHDNIEVFAPKKARYFAQKTPGKPYDKGLVKEQSDRDIYGDYDRVVVKSEDGMRWPRSVQYFKTPESEKQYPTIHKTQKSIGILSWLIRTYSLDNELVLDNCMGSGSTGVAAIKEGRQFIGIEQCPEYYGKAVSWLAEESGKHGMSMTQGFG